MAQRRAARFVYRCEVSVTTMLDELGWHSLKQRRADQRLIMLYKIVHNLVELIFLIPLTRHSRNSQTKSFRIPYDQDQLMVQKETMLAAIPLTERKSI